MKTVKNVLSIKFKVKPMIFGILICIFVFQNALEEICTPISYFDELVALFGIFITVYYVIGRKEKTLTKNQIIYFILIIAFVGAGLIANIIFEYQHFKIAFVDMFINIKFFSTILLGYYLFRDTSWNVLEQGTIFSARIITLFLFALFLIDRLFDLYPAEIRYGIKSAKLFFQHPTYFAGAMAFLVVLMTVFFKKNNCIYILLDLLMLFLTLRSKAMTSVFVYILLYMMVIVYKKRITKWHVLLIGAFCIIFGWKQISYYFLFYKGVSARSVMTITSFKIVKQYFPIGTGFGTYGSALAGQYYSPVYFKYGFTNIYGLGMGANGMFLSDTFWPIILGQTGFIGTIAYLTIIILIIKKVMLIRAVNIYAYLGVLFAMMYLLIASIAESAFCNPLSVPFALIIGIVFGKFDKICEKEKK